MTPERWQKVKEIFQAALERAPSERSEFLTSACSKDQALRKEVESLLTAHEKDGSFIDSPAYKAAAEILVNQQQLAVGQTIGRYEIRSKIGEGGMGEVYLARDTELDRTVAIKVLPGTLASDRQRLQRFIQEAKAASALNHPHILTIHEIGAAGNSRFMATEFIDGETLRQHVQSPLKLTEILEIAIQTASALATAHAAGIIHRDIKPENIMVRRDGYVKVLDFGLAKLTEPLGSTIDAEALTKAMVNTRAGTVMGTANYMSPEQAKGTHVDARSDIWSLGAVLYEMVAGRVPFPGETPTETISLILQKDAAPLTLFAAHVPGELERIVAKALSKDREERYQTMKDLLIDLRNLKRKLEVDAEIDRTASPELRAAGLSAGSGQAAVATASGAVATAQPSVPHSASSAEYIVAGIKKYKIAVAMISLAVLIGGVTIAGMYLRGRTANAAIKSVAVMPFVNEGVNADLEYLSDGITDSLINSLSQLPNLKVMSRNSAFHYKGTDVDAQSVAKELKVQAVLTGRVTQRGEDLWINVELINALDNSQIWGQQYNRRLTDVFTVQEEMAQDISEHLRLKLSGADRRQLTKRPTENLKAFQYYMQGRTYAHRRTREDLLTAIRYFEKAIEEDGNYALAYAGLSDAYAGLGVRGYIAPIEGQRKAEEAARHALALDDNLAEAHSALGQAYVMFAPYNLSLGDRELRRAIELSPSSASAHLFLGNSLAQDRRFDEASAEYLKARELDPLSSGIARQVAMPYYLKRDYARALELLLQANELGPAFVNTWDIGVYIQNSLFNEALAEVEKEKRERKSDPILVYDTGMVYAAQGKRAEALQIIKELEAMSGASPSQAHWIAKIYAALNENELALTWLERGIATGAIGFFLKDEPVWDPIRSDPRFADLLRRMGIPA